MNPFDPHEAVAAPHWLHDALRVALAVGLAMAMVAANHPLIVWLNS